MSKKLLLLLSICVPLLLTSCITTGSYLLYSSMKSSNPLLNEHGMPIRVPARDYDPKGRRTFIFMPVEKRVQNYGYGGFYSQFRSETDKKKVTLSYAKYVGMEGYFETNMPFYRGKNSDYYNVVLSNNERFVFAAGKTDLLGRDGCLIWTKDLQVLIAFATSGEPIYPGSKITHRGLSGIEYVLSNGQHINRSTFNEFLELLDITSLPAADKDQLFELLTKNIFSRTYDAIDRQHRISSPPGLLRLRVNLNEDGTCSLSLDVEYTADDWLFIDEITIHHNGANYSKVMPFTYNTIPGGQGKIKETASIYLDDTDYYRFRQIVESYSVTVRLRGKDRDEDISLTRTELWGLRVLLDVYELMRKSVVE